MPTRKLDHRASRRTALDAQKRAAIVSAVEQGLSVSRAAATIGVCRSTVAKWRERYPEFDEEVFQAESRCIQQLTDNITTAAQSDWRAAAHLLSVRWPHEYSERTQANAASASDRAESLSWGLQKVEERLRASGHWERLQEVICSISAGESRPAMELEECGETAAGVPILATS